MSCAAPIRRAWREREGGRKVAAKRLRGNAIVASPSPPRVAEYETSLKRRNRVHGGTNLYISYADVDYRRQIFASTVCAWRVVVVAANERTAAPSAAMALKEVLSTLISPLGVMLSLLWYLFVVRGNGTAALFGLGRGADGSGGGGGLVMVVGAVVFATLASRMMSSKGRGPRGPYLTSPVTKLHSSGGAVASGSVPALGPLTFGVASMQVSRSVVCERCEGGGAARERGDCATGQRAPRGGRCVAGHPPVSSSRASSPVSRC